MVAVYLRHLSSPNWEILGSTYLESHDFSLFLNQRLLLPSLPTVSPSMRCLYSPFAGHEHELLHLLSPDKSWRSNQCPGSHTGVCSAQTQSPTLLGAWLLTPAATEGAGSWDFFRHSPFIWINFPPELFHHAQDKWIRPYTVTHSAPACMSARIRLSTSPVVFNTSHWTTAGCVASSRKVSPSFPSLPYGAVSLETLLEALKVKKVSRKCWMQIISSNSENWGSWAGELEHGRWAVTGSNRKENCPSWDIFLGTTEMPDCKQGSRGWGWMG